MCLTECKRYVENLSEKLEKALKVLPCSISEINVAQTMKEIRKALITADVDFRSLNNLLTRSKKRPLVKKYSMRSNPVNYSQNNARRITELMGSSHSEVNFSNPTVILVAGLQALVKLPLAES